MIILFDLDGTLRPQISGNFNPQPFGVAFTINKRGKIKWKF
jgi:hypothetical protein